MIRLAQHFLSALAHKCFSHWCKAEGKLKEPNSKRHTQFSHLLPGPIWLSYFYSAPLLFLSIQEELQEFHTDYMQHLDVILPKSHEDLCAAAQVSIHTGFEKTGWEFLFVLPDEDGGWDPLQDVSKKTLTLIDEITVSVFVLLLLLIGGPCQFFMPLRSTHNIWWHGTMRIRAISAEQAAGVKWRSENSFWRPSCGFSLQLQTHRHIPQSPSPIFPLDEVAYKQDGVEWRQIYSRGLYMGISNHWWCTVCLSHNSG